MTAFRPITPRRAVEFVEAAGIPEAQRIIADFAAAGLVKSYALAIDTLDASGRRTSVRGSAVPTELWQRVIREGVAADVWSGGTVRLAGSGQIDGAPEVTITGMGFGEKFLQRLVDHHGGSAPAEVRPAVGAAVQAQTPAKEKQPAVPARRRADPAAIPTGAILATVNQTMAALGLGRTKVNDLMNDGRLVRRKVDGSTKIEVESIYALAGARSEP